jgi:hypothetical protein
MAVKKEKDQQGDPSTELLRDLLIAQLGLAGVAGAEIRKIAGCDMNRVTRILKPINKAQSKERKS